MSVLHDEVRVMWPSLGQTDVIKDNVGMKLVHLQVFL